MRHRFSSYPQGPPCLHAGGCLSSFDLGCGSLGLVGLRGASASMAAFSFWASQICGRSFLHFFPRVMLAHALGAHYLRRSVSSVLCLSHLNHPVSQLPLSVQHLTLLKQLLQLCSRPVGLPTRSTQSCTMDNVV